MQSSVPKGDEIVLAFPASLERLGSAKEVRSTLLASSLRSLRGRGLFEKYESLLPPTYRPAVLGSLAGQWLPIDVAYAHYSACEALDLPVSEQLAMGGDVSSLLHETLLGTVVRASKSSKAPDTTPWTLLPHGNELFRRTLRGGGGTQVTKVAPREALVEMVGVPLLAIPYYRNGLRGLYRAAVELFCKQAFVRECAPLPAHGPAAARLRITWM